MANALEWLSGARLSNELSHRFQQWGIPTAWAENWGDALAPTVLPHHITAYYAARERGQSPTQARQFATDDAFRTAAAAAAVYGGVAGAGAYGAGGAAGSGGGVTGTGAGAGFSGVGSEGSLLGGTQMGAGGLYSGVGAGADSAALGGGGSVLGSGAGYTPLAGSQAGIMAGDTGAGAGGLNYAKLIKSMGQNMGQSQPQRQAPGDNGMQALLQALMAQQGKPQQQTPLFSSEQQ